MGGDKELLREGRKMFHFDSNPHQERFTKIVNMKKTCFHQVIDKNLHQVTDRKTPRFDNLPVRVHYGMQPVSNG